MEPWGTRDVLRSCGGAYNRKNVNNYLNLCKEIFEPPRDKTNIMTCAPSEDSDQPGHPPSLIRVFAVRSMGS